MRVLILTDHSTHSRENSLYALAKAMAAHPACQTLWLASRSRPFNYQFFYAFDSTQVKAICVSQDLSFESVEEVFENESRVVSVTDFDVIFLRLPRPIPEGFFRFISSVAGEERIVNKPSGIEITSNKKFLLELKDLCPPIRLCTTFEEVKAFQALWPIVLKPLENYGGKGILRVENDHIILPDGPLSLDENKTLLQPGFKLGGYLGMQFLPRVSEGDKRTIVINGEIIGSSLRLPPDGSWLCNASQGGQSGFAEVDQDEIEMVKRLNQVLLPHGIAMYGLDTLVGNQGVRVLSEINTLSIGGLIQMANYTGQPLVEKAADLLFHYFKKHIRSSR